MATVGDKYIMFTTSYRDDDSDLANPFINVFAYEATGGLPTAAELNSAFQGSVLPAWVAAINLHTVMRQIQVINLDDITDFFIDNINEAGEQSGDRLNPFMAFEFEYVRAIRGVHSGRKSIGGLDENMLTNGVETVGQRALLDELAGDLGGVIASLAASFTPRIWRRQGTYKVAGTPTAFPHTFYPLSEVVYRRVSTQNSRKR